jgi:pyroglutamyl-peptidase
MKTLLLTGFERFDDYSVNPSAELAKTMNGKKAGPFDIVGVVLPLSYQTALNLFTEAIDKAHPSFILCCGQAERGAISFERIAVNAIGTTRADNQGYTPESDLIVPDGPPAYFTSIDPHTLAKRLQEEGIPALVSYHAGTFGCNWLLYNVLHLISQGRLKARATFMHVPPLPSQAIEKSNMALPTMPLETLVRAVKVIAPLLS